MNLRLVRDALGNGHLRGRGDPEPGSQFKFKAADFTFESTNDEWWVIAGSGAT